MVRSRKSKSSKKKGSSQSQLVSLPTEVLKLLGLYLNLRPTTLGAATLGRQRVEKGLRALTSTCKLFYDLFKPDRYHSLLLGGVAKDLDFVSSLLKEEDILALIQNLQISSLSSLGEKFHAPFATFLSRLKSLTSFIFSCSGPVPPSIVQAISNPRRHPLLVDISVLDFALVSIEEFVKARRSVGKPSFSSLKRIILTEEPPDALFYPEYLREEGDMEPRWLKKHPKRRWPVIEHTLFHHVSNLLARSSLTLEHLELNFDPEFQPQNFDIDETAIHTLLSTPNRAPCRDLRSPHPSQLVFPRLVKLALPLANLGSPVFRTLFRTSPNLRRVSVQHIDSDEIGAYDSVAYGSGSLTRLEVLDVSAYSSDLVGPTTGPIWNLIRAPLPSVLRKLHLHLRSTDEELLRFLRGRFVELEDLFITASTWDCAMDAITACFSSLPKLKKLNFNFPPDITFPPSLVPNVEELAAEDFLLYTSSEILEILDLYFNDAKNRSHFVDIISRLARGALTRLESVSWTLDPKLTLSFKITRNEELVVELKLQHFDLDSRAEDEAEWDALRESDDEDDDGSDEEGSEEEEEDEETSSLALADATDIPTPSSPPSLPAASTSPIEPGAEGPLSPEPLLPSAKFTSTSSPPKPSVEPSTQTDSLVDSTSSPSNTSPPPAPLSSDPLSPRTSDEYSFPDPPITPELDGRIERREKRLVSVLPFFEDDDNDQLEEGSSSSRNAEAQVGSGEGAQVDRFWENWVFLFELD